jgi:hypothetical protein
MNLEEKNNYKYLIKTTLDNTTTIHHSSKVSDIKYFEKDGKYYCNVIFESPLEPDIYINK